VIPFRRGYVYWVRMPEEDKKRPALVLSHDIRNDRAPTVVVIPCTTVRRLGPWHVPLRKGEGGLRVSSVAKCEDITLLSKDKLAEGSLGGPVSNERLVQIRDAILRALDLD
jgi:mRNA interferase MazF